MSHWVNFRTILGGIAIGALLAVGLFYSSGQKFELSGLDLFFAVTTVVSLGFNLWQLFRDQYKYAPLKNSLIGLFNDLKGKQLRAHQRSMLIYTKHGLELPVEATRLEFYDFAQEMSQSLDQLREHVVASIQTLDPNASTQQVFRAAEFGLNEQERRFREQGLERYLAQNAAAQAAAQQQPAQQEQPR